MTPEERIGSRLDELVKTRVDEDDLGSCIRWASNALTVARQLLGPNDFSVKLIEDAMSRAAQYKQPPESLNTQARGVLQALKLDFEGGHLVNIRNQIRTDVESDFLSQAHRLLEDGSKDPAAMLIGAVLEDALRQLCRGNGVSGGDNIESMNAPLRTAGVYGLPQQQQVTAWAAIRNKADHGHFDQYDIAEVRVMQQGVAGFISKYMT